LFVLSYRTFRSGRVVSAVITPGGQLKSREKIEPLLTPPTNKPCFHSSHAAASERRRLAMVIDDWSMDQRRAPKTHFGELSLVDGWSMAGRDGRVVGEQAENLAALALIKPTDERTNEERSYIATEASDRAPDDRRPTTADCRCLVLRESAALAAIDASRMVDLRAGSKPASKRRLPPNFRSP
uniref:MOSC domain-containing protein n=1 Tax=Soboliphyme baturini TaxID=241478 RepID=A0A183IGC1_9BILA